MKITKTFLWCDLHVNTLVSLSSPSSIMLLKTISVLVSRSIASAFGIRSRSRRDTHNTRTAIDIWQNSTRSCPVCARWLCRHCRRAAWRTPSYCCLSVPKRSKWRDVKGRATWWWRWSAMPSISSSLDDSRNSIGENGSSTSFNSQLSCISRSLISRHLNSIFSSNASIWHVRSCS